MKTIYKYPLGIPAAILTLPGNAQVLSVGLQREEPVMWALVDPANEEVPRTFVVTGTGHAMPYEGKFLGTLQRRDGIVLHVFEVTP